MDRQATTVAKTLVRANFDLAANVSLNLAAKVALNLEVRFDVFTELDEIFLGGVLHADVRADARRFEGLGGAGATDSVNVGKCNLQSLLAGEVDTGHTCHVVGAPVIPRRSSSHLPDEPSGLGLRTEGRVFALDVILWAVVPGSAT